MSKKQTPSNLAHHAPDFAEKLVAVAQTGDVQAVRSMLAQILPPVKAIDQPQVDELTLPINFNC